MLFSIISLQNFKIEHHSLYVVFSLLHRVISMTSALCLTVYSMKNDYACKQSSKGGLVVTRLVG